MSFVKNPQLFNRKVTYLLILLWWIANKTNNQSDFKCNHQMYFSELWTAKTRFSSNRNSFWMLMVLSHVGVASNKVREYEVCKGIYKHSHAIKCKLRVIGNDKILFGYCSLLCSKIFLLKPWMHLNKKPISTYI